MISELGMSIYDLFVQHHFCELSPLEPNSNFLNEKDAVNVDLGRLLSLMECYDVSVCKHEYV